MRKLEASTMTGAAPETNGHIVRERLTTWINTYIPALAALHFEGGDLPPHIAPIAVSESLNGLLDLCRRDGAEQPVPDPHRRALQIYYRRLVKDEVIARQHLGMPPAPQAAPDTTMSQLLAAMTTLQRQGEATARDI